MNVFQPLRFPQNSLAKILLYFMLTATFMVSAQTTFTESAAAYGLNIGGNKEGGHAWADYDLDGDFDLVINRNGSGYLMRNDGGSFSNQTTALAPNFNSGTLARSVLFVDFNNDGYPDIFRNHYNNLRIYLQDPATNRFGNGTGGTTPNQTFTTLTDGMNTEGAGALDYDGDGDLDIFVDNHNFGIDILQNDGNGNFTHVTRKADSPNPPYNVADPTTWPLGLVQDATDGDYGSATDYNDDGWVDIVVRKNNQVDLFANLGGSFQNGVDIDQANNSNKGSVAFFDFDNDGDQDYIVGNFGLNSQLKASQEEPVQLYVTDFDRNGSLDPILCSYVMGESYPVFSKDDLIGQLPNLKRKYVNYSDYADQKITDIFTPQELADATVLEAQTFATIYIENLGNNQFHSTPLPTPAQFSPVYGILVQDFNADGNMDILMAGNFFGTRVKYGRYDANKGVLLLGDGHGNFAATGNEESGLGIDGEVRDISIVQQADGSQLVIFALNNDSINTYRFNPKN